MKSLKDNQDRTPPKYATANGFVIGEFSAEMKHHEATTGQKMQSIDIAELSNEMKVLVTPVRPYKLMFTYTGGQQQSSKCHFAFFETDQLRVRGGLNHMQQEL